MKKSAVTSAKAASAAVKSRRGHVRDRVAGHLRHGLMAGMFIPGQVMSLRKLAAAFGTSPMPVRDALSQLVAANVLEETPGRSVRVPRIPAEKLSELFEVRDMIEGMAARAACRNIDAATIRRLTAINSDLIAGIARRDFMACLSANQQFHFTLYEAADSDVLMRLIESLWLRSGPTMYFSLLAPDTPWDAAAHKDIIEGLKQKNAAAVQRALSRDIRSTARHLASIDKGRRPLLMADASQLDISLEV